LYSGLIKHRVLKEDGKVGTYISRYIITILCLFPSR